MIRNLSVWIVTYQNAPDLHANLDSLFAHADLGLCHMHVNIINNHSQFQLHDKFQHKVTVHHNHLRSDHSLGHLSRNWNQALQLGFQDLDHAHVDCVITSQDDVIWKPNWFSWLLTATSRYSLISQGAGDAVMIYKPEAVKRIGLWDERFCPSFYHEADYFLRALIYNPDASSINDNFHGRCWNPIQTTMIQVPPVNTMRHQAKQDSLHKAHVPWQVWNHKWHVNPVGWTPELLENLPHHSNCANFILYPHFELKVENLLDKKYII